MRSVSKKVTFYGGASEQDWYPFSSSIKTVLINKGETSIGDYAFYGCTGLTSITFPDGMASIETSIYQKIRFTPFDALFLVL